MKAIMVEDIVKVTSEPTAEALSLCTLKKGEIVETGKVTRKKKESWVEVTLAGGQKGYISGQTRIFVVRQIEVTSEVDLIAEPAENAAVLKSLPKGTVITAIGVEKNDSGSWYHVTDKEGGDGYISSRAKYRVYQEPSVAGGTKLMVTGGIFAVMGVVFLVTSLNQESGSSTLFLVVGLIGLGAVQLVQGILQWRKAKKKKKPIKQKEQTFFVCSFFHF